MTGTLRGSVGTAEDAGTACFWLEGTGAARSYVVWPHGWSATDHPLRVLDDWGRRVATVGDRLEGAGASSGAGVGAPMTEVKGCPTTRTTTGFGSVSRAG